MYICALTSKGAFRNAGGFAFGGGDFGFEASLEI
jgi:hypothetical protein